MTARSFFVLLLVLLLLAPVAEKKNAEIVAFNTNTHKFHCLTCSAAKRCTRNCIDITREEAKARGGVPCKICGGSCSIE